MKKPAVRRRYWARSMAGWPAFSRARPNAVHRALASLEEAGFIHQLVTQNVDGLHRQAGSRQVTDLHGRLDSVICMDCGQSFRRSDFQQRPGKPIHGKTGGIQGDACDWLLPDGVFGIPLLPGRGGAKDPHSRHQSGQDPCRSSYRVETPRRLRRGAADVVRLSERIAGSGLTGRHRSWYLCCSAPKLTDLKGF